MNLGFSLSLVGEWESAGVVDAVIAPGSRSGPMAVALGMGGKIAVHTIVDERSAGFLAVGLSKVSGRPTVLLTTSGTAAANLRPSVTEAFHAGVPLIVLTADRPPEVHKFGAAQTIEQGDLFSDVVLFRTSTSVPDGVNRKFWRALGSRAFHETMSNPLGRGPVHLNLAFREPLIEEYPDVVAPRKPGEPWYRVHRADSEALQRQLQEAGRVLVVAGEADKTLTSDDVAKCAELGWPVIAGPTSGFRHSSKCSLGSFEAFLRSERIRKRVKPDTVILLGGDLASRTVNGFVSEAALGGAQVVRVSGSWYWRDPLGVVTDMYFGSAHSFFATLEPSARSNDYLREMLSLDRASFDGISAGMGTGLSDPMVSARIYDGAGADDMVFVSSSMPTRDLEWFAPMVDSPPSVYSNRGTNGIDGVISSFLGVAIAHRRLHPAGKSYLLIGDLAFRHDIGVLAKVAGEGLDLCICVTDNGGGGIFSFSPRSATLTREEFERLFAIPQNGDLAAIGTGFGLYTQVVSDDLSLRAALAEFGASGGVRLIVFRSDRYENVELHRRALESGMLGAERLMGESEI